MNARKVFSRFLVLFIALFSVENFLWGQTTLTVSPSTQEVIVDASVTVQITITDVTNFHGYSVSVGFDNSILQYQSINATSGTLLGSFPNTFFVSAQPSGNPNTVQVDQAILGNTSTSGSGILFSITFTAISPGISPITILSYDLRDGNNQPISASVSSGQVEVSLPVPIQLASFAATVIRDNQVEVTWKTVSETNNYGFEVYRKRNENGEWGKLGFVRGHGTTLAPQAYSYLDKSVGFGKYFYQIKQVDLDGKSRVFPEMAVTVGAGPAKFVLAQNYPNPFNPSTTIEFAIPQNSFATMKLYNILGEEVATLFRGELAAGIHSVEWSPKNLASGVYVYRLEADNGMQHFVATRRLMLMR